MYKIWICFAIAFILKIVITLCLLCPLQLKVQLAQAVQQLNLPLHHQNWEVITNAYLAIHPLIRRNYFKSITSKHMERKRLQFLNKHHKYGCRRWCQYNVLMSRTCISAVCPNSLSIYLYKQEKLLLLLLIWYDAIIISHE